MRYTKQQSEFIIKNYKGISSQELADKFNSRFGTKRAASSINAFKGHHKLRSGYNNYFKPGMVPWNKGTKGLTKSNKGSFKPVPIGTIHSSETKKLIKTSNGWQQYSRYIYEKYHNCKLNQNERINFLDNNNTNFSEENLIKVTKQEVARINHDGYIFDDAELNKVGINIVRLKMKVREMNVNNRKNKRVDRC